MTPIITFYLNGQEYKLLKPITLYELINYFNYKKKIFIVEHNSVIRNQDHWKKIVLTKNDIIEIITIVGGG